MDLRSDERRELKRAAGDPDTSLGELELAVYAVLVEPSSPCLLGKLRKFPAEQGNYREDGPKQGPVGPNCPEIIPQKRGFSIVFPGRGEQGFN